MTKKQKRLMLSTAEFVSLASIALTMTEQARQLLSLPVLISIVSVCVLMHAAVNGARDGSAAVGIGIGIAWIGFLALAVQHWSGDLDSLTAAGTAVMLLGVIISRARRESEAAK